MKENRICSFFGHKYRPRYNSKLPDRVTSLGAAINHQEIEALKDKTYLFDMCERCGDVKNEELAVAARTEGMRP